MNQEINEVGAALLVAIHDSLDTEEIATQFLLDFLATAKKD